MTKHRIRVALIIPGGIATGKDNIGVPVLERLVRRLSVQFEVTVFSLFKINDDFVPDTFELIDVSSNAPYVKLWKCFAAFRTHHKIRPFKIVHGFWAMPSGFLAVLIGKRYGIKSIVSVLGGDAISLPQINYGQLRRWLPRTLVLWTLSNANNVVTLTRYLWDKLLDAGMKQRQISVIPHGVDHLQFPYIDRPLSRPINFIHVANMHPVKDQLTLLRTFKIISNRADARLEIIGGGISLAEIKKNVADLGLKDKVILAGALAYKEIPYHYALADFLLQTSLSEGQSVVANEAMSSGVIVCGTAVGLLYDEPQLFVTVNVGDYENLARKILELMEDITRMKQLKADAHQWALKHDINWTSQMYSALYKQG